jgi:hypothetical protein
MNKIWILFAVWAVSATVVQAEEPGLPVFRAETIDSKVIIGYGTAIGDVDGDGKPDILLADKKQFVWYQNPTWKRHVIAENLTERDNVCIAARDIDGDGKVEIAVGGQWNPGDTVNSGSVHYLVAPPDRTRKWRPIELHHEPVVHRMRWVKLTETEFVLVVAPLHGRGNRGGQGQGVKLLAYRMPKNIDDPWATETLDDSLHVTHNFDVAQWNDKTAAEEILYLGREGAKVISHDGQQWQRAVLNQVQGGSEIRMGQLATDKYFLATIEPFHGNELVCYQAESLQASGPSPLNFPRRVVLDDDFNQGHAVATADLIGDGSQQIVAGWRQPNQAGKVGVKLYYPVNDQATQWKSIFIDDNSMACEDLRIGDLNADGRLDIVAAGRATHNLKIYWNEGTQPGN